jgi:hypothetical protein
MSENNEVSPPGLEDEDREIKSDMDEEQLLIEETGRQVG